MGVRSLILDFSHACLYPFRFDDCETSDAAKKMGPEDFLRPLFCAWIVISNFAAGQPATFSTNRIRMAATWARMAEP